LYSFRYSERLNRILRKLSKKDKNLYEQILKKVEEVISSPNPDYYKNLRYDMKDCKRVHIGHFVLVFSVDKNNSIISFEDFDHHDNIYD